MAITSVENMLKMSGVQSILMQLIEKAAPDLAKQAKDIGDIIVAFKTQLDRVEVRQQMIIDALFDNGRQENDDGRRNESSIAGNVGSHSGVGESAARRGDVAGN